MDFYGLDHEGCELRMNRIIGLSKRRVVPISGGEGDTLLVVRRPERNLLDRRVEGQRRWGRERAGRQGQNEDVPVSVEGVEGRPGRDAPERSPMRCSVNVFRP